MTIDPDFDDFALNMVMNSDFSTSGTIPINSAASRDGAYGLINFIDNYFIMPAKIRKYGLTSMILNCIEVEANF